MKVATQRGNSSWRPLVPREHGAWAVLFGPLVLVWVSFGNLDPRLPLFVIALTSLFLAHEPLAKLSRSLKRGRTSAESGWKRGLGLYLSLALVSGLILVLGYQLVYLVPVGLVAGGLLCIRIWLTSKRRDRSLAGELVGIVGLTLGAPAGYYVCRGQIDSNALWLWLLSILFFSSGVFYVRMRVSQLASKKDRALRHRQNAVYHSALAFVLVLLAAVDWLPPLAPFAYLPILVRAFWRYDRSQGRISFKKLGYGEVGFAVFFVLFLSAILTAQGWWS